jgi:hypothetical protein
VDRESAPLVRKKSKHYPERMRLTALVLSGSPTLHGPPRCARGLAQKPGPSSGTSGPQRPGGWLRRMAVQCRHARGGGLWRRRAPCRTITARFFPAFGRKSDRRFGPQSLSGATVAHGVHIGCSGANVLPDAEGLDWPRTAVEQGVEPTVSGPLSKRDYLWWSVSAEGWSVMAVL